MDSLQSLLSKRADFSPINPDPSLQTPQPSANTNPPTKEEPQNIPASNYQNTPDAAKITQILLNLRAQIDAALLLVNNPPPSPAPVKTTPPPTDIDRGNQNTPNENNANKNQLQVIEGVFNGEKMIGPDGREYAVPTNYASKSKLVEGDMMKLTITPTGAFIYKQIGPIERRRLIGEAALDDKTGQWSVSTNHKTYKILTASTTFFRAKPGMQAVILVPKDGESRWAAVENIFNPNQY